MAIIQGNAKKSTAAGGFYPKTIEGSLRFNDDDSAYLSKSMNTVTGAWTLSMWIKRTGIGKSYDPIGSFRADEYRFENDALKIESGFTSSMLFRDPSAWYHLVFSDSGSNQTVYVNGASIGTTGFSRDFGDSGTVFGRMAYNSTYFDGYLAEVHFTDGTAYDADDFGELISGVWVPKNPSVTYGTNGFHLTFQPELESFVGDYLLVGGGGGGGRFIGGGGGAGGFREFLGQKLYKGYDYTITVGDGGAGAPVSEQGSDGEDSVFGFQTAAGGGGAGAGATGTASEAYGRDGGSGGGAAYDGGANGGTGNTPPAIPDQGYDGGSGYNGGTNHGGGGGGASEDGLDGTASTGGDGRTTSIITTTIATSASVGEVSGGFVYFSGGGGGAADLGSTAGLGGLGGGGDGGGGRGASGTSSAGGTNTGGGGGGSEIATPTPNGRDGGSGVVIIKVPDSVTGTFSAGCTVTTSTAVSGYNIYIVKATSTTSETVSFS